MKKNINAYGKIKFLNIHIHLEEIAHKQKSKDFKPPLLADGVFMRAK